MEQASTPESRSTAPKQRPPVRWHAAVMAIAGSGCAALGLTVMLGWHIRNAALLQVRPGYIAMVYNTALGFVTGGMALFLLLRGKRRAAAWCGGALVLLGLLSTIEHLFDLDLGLDQLLMDHYITVQTSHPGRMAPNTALCFALGGAGILAMGLARRGRWQPPVSGILGSMVAAVGLNALFGYLSGIRIAYGWGPLIPMAVHTAAGFVMLAAGIIASAWRDGIRPGAPAPAWCSVLLGVAVATITLGQWQALVVKEQSEIQGMVTREVGHVRSEVASLMKARMHQMTRMAIRWGKRTDLSFEEWEADAGSFIGHDLGYRAIARVDSSAHPHWVAPRENELADGGLGFASWDSFKLAMAQARQDHTVRVARSRGLPAGEEGLLAFAPVFSGGEFGGWIVAAFSARHLLDEVLDEEGRSGDYSITVLDGAEEVFRLEGVDGASDQEWIEEHELPLPGVTWRLRVAPTAALLARVRSVLPQVVLASGVAGGFLLGLALHLAMKARLREKEARIAREALEREMAEREIAQSALLQNEARLQSILDNANAVICLKDAHARYVLVNRRYETLFRVAREEVLGKTDQEVFPREVAEAFQANDRRVLESRAPLELEETVPHEGGARTFITVRFPLRDAGGAVYAIGGISTEITERKKMEAALRESEERLARIVETIAEGIFILDREGRISFANAMAEEMFGLSRSVMTRRGYDDPAWGVTSVDGKPLPADQLPFARVMQSGAPVQGAELAVQRSDGACLFVSVNAAPIREASGGISGVVASVVDVTRRKEVDQLKDEFVSTVSHELRTPLTSLRGFAELMLSREFPAEKQREFLSIIRNEAVRLTALINDFLDIQKIESGRQRYDFKSVELAPLAAETATLFGREGGGHSVVLEVPGDLPLVWADADRLRQVLSNLLSNAIKFSPQGGRVLVGARAEEGKVVLWVSDQGIGMSPQTLAMLFTRFYRADNHETRRIGGTGLGLALVKEIVQAHGGRVWVESEPGKGSTFFVSLPAAEAAAPVGPLPGRASEEAKRILLVEDDEAFSRLLSEHFQARGFSVARTAKGEEALDLARLAPPGLCMIDIHLAGRLDGWDVLLALKNDLTLSSVPVLIISVSEKINARGLAVAGGDYLFKPVSPERLRKTIQAQLPSLHGKQVLVADDDPGFRQQVRECLRGEPEVEVEVEEAATGRDALRRIAERMPDLLLLDLIMPEMDGFEVLRSLRLDRRAVNLPVLVVTGINLTPGERDYIKRRMASLVTKRDASLEQIQKAAEQVLLSREGERT